MNIAAILVLEDAGGTSLATARALLAAPLPRVPRLRQRLHRAPVGPGRPFWADDPGFDLDHHLDGVVLAADPGPGDDDAPSALLQLAADLACRHLPREGPLWTARWVTGFGEQAALVLVVHHAMADGLGGLAALADGGAEPGERGLPPSSSPQPRPGRRRLAAAGAPGAGGAGWARRRGARHPRARPGPRTPPARTGNVPEPPHGPGPLAHHGLRALDAVVALAHARRCTVNDVVLTAIVGAMAGILRRRGKRPDELVVSVPVSSRRVAGVEDLGNRTGVVPMRLPTAGPPPGELDRPVAVNPGNVGVSFDVMSCAGQLGVTVVADPHVVPDQAELTALLEDELGQLLRGSRDAAGS